MRLLKLTAWHPEPEERKLVYVVPDKVVAIQDYGHCTMMYMAGTSASMYVVESAEEVVAELEELLSSSACQLRSSRLVS